MIDTVRTLRATITLARDNASASRKLALEGGINAPDCLTFAIECEAVALDCEARLAEIGGAL